MNLKNGAAFSVRNRLTNRRGWRKRMNPAIFGSHRRGFNSHMARSGTWQIMALVAGESFPRWRMNVNGKRFMSFLRGSAYKKTWDHDPFQMFPPCPDRIVTQKGGWARICQMALSSLQLFMPRMGTQNEEIPISAKVSAPPGANRRVKWPARSLGKWFSFFAGNRLQNGLILVPANPPYPPRIGATGNHHSGKCFCHVSGNRRSNCDAHELPYFSASFAKNSRGPAGIINPRHRDDG